MNIVDTISFVLNFRNFYNTKEKEKQFERKIELVLDYDANDLAKKVNEKDIGMKGSYNGYSFFYNKHWKALTITVPHNKIVNATATEIKSEIIQVIMLLFNLAEDEIPPIMLSRIDIKNDYFYSSPEQLIIIKYILGEAKGKYAGYKKEIQQDDGGKFVVKYNSTIKNKHNEKCKTTRNTFKNISVKRYQRNISSNNDSEHGDYIEYCFYDKGAEILFKVAEGRAGEEEIAKYANIFRTEIRIKNGRLNSNKHEKNITKDLENYYNKKTCNELYDKHAAEIIGVNDFYRIDIASEIIQNSRYTKPKKQKLIELLRTVNKKGYSYAEELWINKYSKATFYNHIHAIEDLGLNILTFNTKIAGTKIATKVMPNFGQRKYGVIE